MSKKIILITVSCIFLLGMVQGGASAACHDDCYSSCCGHDTMCNEPVVVNCLSNCIKGCDGDKIPERSADVKSSDNLNVQTCQANNRSEVRACDYPKREVEATRECLADARQHFDDCMQAIGK
jgi:hypothetical protein